MKKKILIILSIVIVLVIGGLILYKHETTLPEPKVSEGTRGELGIDANINEKNIIFIYYFDLGFLFYAYMC